MSTEDPFETFVRIVAAFGSIAKGDPVFAERVRRQAELYREMAITEPDSLRREIQSLHAGPDLSPDFPELVLNAASQIPRESADDFPFFPPAHDLFHFLRRGAQALSPSTVHSSLCAALQFDMPVLRAALMEAMRPAAPAGFERRVRTLSEVLRNTAENWYRPILKCALSISYHSRSLHNATVPEELGALLAACRDSNDVPKTLLQDELRIIRNAVAHSHLKLDLDGEQVTFINQTRRGTQETLGPLAWEELVALADSILNHCWALTLACKSQRRLMAEAA